MEDSAGGGFLPASRSSSWDLGAQVAASASQSAVLKRKSPWIVNRIYDSIFFIFSPLIALALGLAIAGSPLTEASYTVGEYHGSAANLFIGIFIASHLFIVFFRSHLNQKIFQSYPYRFTVVPVVLLVGMYFSDWIAISAYVLAIWWDVYHSSLQTFGLGRIYDVKNGNDPNVGRRLDILLNLLIYAGPILAGAALMEHIEEFGEFSRIGSAFFTSVPAYVESNQRYLTWAMILFGTPFTAYYVYAYWRYHRQGYRVSHQKVLLLASTALCSIYTWGFDSFGQAFFIMNFFHAFQYFALVWHLESKNMTSFFRLGGLPWGKPIALVLFLVIGFGYGIFSEVSSAQARFTANLVIAVSLMHFWYDGFIWSVRKQQV